MPDVAIVSRDVASAPKDYLLPPGQEIILKAVKASYDGSGGAAAFRPALQLLAPDGTVMWTAQGGTDVAAGGSAAATWFPWWRGVAAAAHPAVPNSAYQQAVLALSPYAYWPMDDPVATGHWTDISGNGHNTALTSVATIITQVGGLIRTSSDTAAIMAGGTQSMLKATASSDSHITAVTAMCWIQTTSASGLQALILDNASTNLIAQRYQLRMSAGVPQWLIADNNGVAHQVNWPVSIADGKPHFIVGTWDLATQYLYVDGVQSTGLANTAPPHSGATNIGLGGSINSLTINAFAGTLDECAVFPAAVAAADITNLFNLATTT